MKTLRHFLSLAAIVTACLTAAPAPDSVKNVTIIGNDTLRFDVTRIEASPGQKIHITLRNEGTMPRDVGGHNWILLKPGHNPIAYATAALSAKNEDYQPKALADEVLASIPLLGPKQAGEVTFEAPTKPGTYTYFCSCPAHCVAGMRGVLVIK